MRRVSQRCGQDGRAFHRTVRPADARGQSRRASYPASPTRVRSICSCRANHIRRCRWTAPDPTGSNCAGQGLDRSGSPGQLRGRRLTAARDRTEDPASESARAGEAASIRDRVAAEGHESRRGRLSQVTLADSRNRKTMAALPGHSEHVRNVAFSARWEMARRGRRLAVQTGRDEDLERGAKR